MPMPDKPVRPTPPARKKAPEPPDPIKMPAGVPLWPIAKVKAYDRNPRSHPPGQVRQIADSMLQFGFTAPVMINQRTDNLVAGHGRLDAAHLLQLPRVPVLVLDLSPEQERAYRIVDNQLGLNSEWNEELLQAELAELSKLNFDMSGLGFDSEDLAALLAPGPTPATKKQKDPDDVPPLMPEPVCRLGDIWKLGDHILMCGDSLDRGSVLRLMAAATGREELVDMVFTDPPYNVDYKGYTAEEMKIANDAMTQEQFKLFLRATFRSYRGIVKPNASMYVCHPSSWQREFESAMQMAGFTVRCQIIWAKNTFAWGHGRYKFQHEPIFYAYVDGQSDRWFGDKSQSTLWQEKKPSANRIHPTAKPVELIERALGNSSDENDVVADLFGGSGSTLVACERWHRRARLMELDPKYADCILVRWQELTEREAFLIENGINYAYGAVKESRNKEKKSK